MSEKSISELRRELEEASAELADRRAALPAHSLRPSQLQEVEELEDRVKELRAEIERTEKKSRD